MTGSTHSKHSPSSSGSVVIQLHCGTLNVAAIEAAVLLAKTLSTSIEGLFIEDEQLEDAATYPFTREISVFSGRARAISSERMRNDMQGCAMAARRRLREIANAHGVAMNYQIQHRHRHDRQCAASPDTRFVTLSQAQLAAGGACLFKAIEDMPQVEGFLVAGADARRRRGPLLLLAQTPAALTRLHATAGPIAKGTGRPLLLQPTDPDPQPFAALRQQLLDQPEPATRLLSPLLAGPAALEGLVQRLDIGLVVLPLTHPLTADRDSLRRLTATLTTPLLLLRPQA